MNPWTPAIAATVLACVPIALEHATSQDLLQDTDTHVLLAAIHARQAPFSWFVGDWPLQNHFYRPVATLAFELDQRLYGSHAAGYGWTNDILCVLCVLLLLWFVRELTDKPWFAGAAAVLFAVWHWTFWMPIGPILGVGMWAVLAVVAWRHKTKFGAFLPAVLAVPFLAEELQGQVSLAGRMIDWLPGRTASVMSVFALIAMASYVRYERLTAARRPQPAPTPLTPPATRSAVIQNPLKTKFAGLWIGLSAIATALAMGAYEQGIMVAPALSGIALILWLLGYKPRWGWQIMFWAIFGGYILVRHRVVPSAPSNYQIQQFRHGPGVCLSLCDYVFAPAKAIPGVIAAWDPSMGLMMLTDGVLVGFLISLAQAGSAVWVIRKHWVLAFGGWALSWGIFFPMAFLKPFDHYQYLPMAMRSIFVVTLAWAVWDAAVSALRPPVQQAPPRSAPAPGSLPHP